MHGWSKIITVLIIVLLSPGLLAAGCAGKDSVGKGKGGMPEKIVVQAPIGPPTAPLFKMAAEGLPDGTGIELIIYKSDEEATTRAVKGEADFTVMAVNLAAKLYNKDVGISLANVTTWGILYLVSTDGKVNRWEDLKGGELYVGSRGSTPDVLTRYLLGKSGLKEGDVKITYLESTQIAQMMINGLINNAVLPEPMLSRVLMNNSRARVVRDFYADWQQFEGSGVKLPQAGTVARNEFAKAYPAAVESFQQAYARALEWTVANPAEAGRLVEEKLQIPAPVFVKSMERTRLNFVRGAGARADVVTYLSRLVEFSPEMIGGKVPDEKFFLAD
ncbi:MAG TPA: ABC transporter substrate-binding protein [Bacillota bacterium]|nr:ABC transporter substrate-binding protein [Bacillota bacterium]